MQCAAVLMALAAAATFMMLSWYHCALAGVALFWLHYTAICFRRFRAEMTLRASGTQGAALSSATSVASIGRKPCLANVTFGSEASITIHAAAQGDAGALARLADLSVPRVGVMEEFSSVSRKDGSREMVSRLQEPMELTVEGARVAAKFAAIVERASVAQRADSPSTVVVQAVDVPLRLLPGLHMLVHRAEAGGPTRCRVACDRSDHRLEQLTQRATFLRDTVRAYGDSLGMGTRRRVAPTKWKVHAATNRRTMSPALLLQRGDRYLVIDDTAEGADAPDALTIEALRSDYPQLAELCAKVATQAVITRRQLTTEEHVSIHACQDGTYDATLHACATPKDYARGAQALLRDSMEASTVVMGFAAILYCM